jgi:2-keto-4-pentenoate hydratase/2-oxohepta-3-ene-1,7-dioic acid hydratase in catechol pathway
MARRGAMKLCRFDHDHIGVVRGDEVFDVSDLFDRLAPWPPAFGDPIIRQAWALKDELGDQTSGRLAIPLAAVRLEAPVAAPGKIIGAPINYRAHIDEAHADPGVGFGRSFADLKDHGLFLKAASSLIGPSDPVRLRFPERRSDHEVELVVVIGREASQVSRDEALAHVFGYAIGLDMTVRGPEWPVLRKSADTYGVLGPWIVSVDEIGDPGALDLSLSVNGEIRQSASTAQLIYDVPALIEYASSFYTLYPGDLIYTGTPEGVSPVQPGDVIEAQIEKIGAMRIDVAPDWFSREPARDGGAMERKQAKERSY